MFKKTNYFLVFIQFETYKKKTCSFEQVLVFYSKAKVI